MLCRRISTFFAIFALTYSIFRGKSVILPSYHHLKKRSLGMLFPSQSEPAEEELFPEASAELTYPVYLAKFLVYPKAAFLEVAFP